MGCPTKQYKKEIAIAISGDKNISDDSIAMKIADELYFKAQLPEFQTWLNGEGNFSNSFEFTEEQLDNITNHSMLVSHDGLQFKMLDEIVHKFKVYKAGIQNKVFTSLEIEQAFVDATVAAMYTVQSKQVQVKRNDKIEYRLVSDLQVKDIKDNPNLDNVNLVIAHLKDVVKIARKDVKLYDGVRKQLKKWADNPMGLIDGIYNQSSDKIKAQIQSQYDELKKLRNDYDTVKAFITDKLNVSILKQMDDFINDLENNTSSTSIMSQARVKLEQTYGDRFMTLDEVNNKENSDALSRNFDDNFVYSKDVVESFNQIIINMINSLPFKSIDNNGNMGIMINPHTRLRETVKFTEVQHNLKWKLANPHSPEHLIQLMRENAHQYMWLNDLADILVDDTKTPNLLQGFFTYFKNTLTPEHVAIIQNDGENTYKTSMRILSPVLGQEMTDSLIGQIMDLRNNPEKIDRIVLLFEQYRESFDNISKNKQDNKLESEQIKSLFTDIKAMLALYDIEVNNSILYKIIRGETLKRGLELNIDTAHTVLNENIKSPLYYITLHSKENETFTDIGNLNTITTLISNYDDSNISASYKAADNATKHGVRLPNGISDFINILHKAEAGEEYAKELLDTLVEYTNHPGLVESNWLVSRVHNDQLVEGFLNKVEDGNLLFHYELNKKYLSKLAVTLNGGLKHINSTESAIFKTLEDKDFALSQLIAFIDNTGKNKNRDMVYLPTPILSDSSNHNFILTNRITLSPTKDYTFDDKGNYKIVPGSTISAIGYQKFKQEYYTMKYEFDYMFDVVNGKIQLKDIKDLVLYENKHYTINKETGEKEYLKNGLPTGKVFKFQVFDGLNDIVKIDNNGVPKYTELNHKAIEENILNEFEKQATQSRLELKELQQFLPDTREYIAGTDKINNEIYQYGDLRTSNAQFAKLILEMTVNNFVSNTELQNMLLGNLDEFPNFAATVKRSKIISTPSIEPHLTENINIQTIDDINVESDLLELYKVWAEVALEQRGLTTENPAYQMIYKDTIDGYKAITATDGQSFYSTNFYVKHLKSLLRFGQYEHLFETYQRNGKTNYRIKDDIALDDIKNMVTVVKSLFGNRSLVNNDGHLVMVSNQIKTSAVPLSDNLFKGSILSELAEYMNDNNVDVVTFRSSQKQMVTGVEDVLHNEKVFDVNTLKDVPTVTIPANSYKVVLDVVDHTRDSENKAGVQFMKLIYGNLEENKEYDVTDENGKKLTGKEVFNLGQELASDNIIETAKDLYNELGATEVDGKLVIIDKKKLSETLERDIKTRGYSDVELKSILLELTNEGNEFNLPLYFSTFNKRWQNVLTSLFTNRITNQKLPGSHVVLISNVFKDSLKNGEKGKVSGSKDLKAIVEVNGEEIDISTLSKSELADLLDKGAKLYLEAYISPFSKQFFDDDGKLIPFEQLEGNPLLDNIGYRIPSSGKHSVATLRVKGWIQSPYSASIIVADDIVNATGTDFDVDSLFMIHKHFTRTQNEDGTYNFKIIPYKQSLEDRYIAYVRDNMNHKYSEYDTDIYEFKEQLDNTYNDFQTNLDVNQYNLKIKLLALKQTGSRIFFSLPIDYQEQYKKFISDQKSNNTFGILQQIELAELTEDILTTDIDDNTRNILNNLLKNQEDIITAYSVTDTDYRNYLKLFRQAKLDIKTSTDYQFALHKLIANYERLEDVDTFSKRRYSSTVSKQARENKLIDIFESILQSKHNMLEKLRPAKFNEHESLTELFPTDMSGNPSWLNTQLKYRTATSAGKRSLSIAASVNANIFVYQNTDASFFIPLEYTYILNDKEAHIKYADLKKQIGDKMFNRMLLNSTLEDLQKKYDVKQNDDGTVTIKHNRIGKNNMDSTNIEYGLITDTVGELVDYTVDAVKNPLPANVNEHSIMWAVTLEAIGMRAFDSIAFLQLPVVKEVVSYIKSTRFVLGGKNNAISSLKFNYKFIIQQAYQVLQNKSISDKEFNGILKELKDDIGFEVSSINFVKESLNPTTNDILDKLLVVCDTKPKYLRNELTKLLRDLLTNKSPDAEIEIMGQIQTAMNIAVKRHNMLDFLAKVEDMSSTLSRVNNALSTDKVGLSPTLTDAHNLVNDITKQRYHEVSTTDNEGNVTLHQGIVTNGTTKNTVEEIYKEDSKYSSYRDKYIYGIQLPLQMLEPLFISETPLFSNLHSKIVGDNIPLGLYEYIENIFSTLGVQDKQAIKDKLYNHTMQTLMMDIDLFKIDNLEAGLLLGLNELTDANDEIISIEDRPFHTLSLAEQIKNIKKELNIQRNDNHILNYITVKNSVYDKRNSKIDIITLKRISMDSTKNLYIKQLKDMFFNATINQNLLVTNIIKYSYLTDGLMFKSNTLAQLIDVDIWQDLKIPEQMRRIHDRAKDDFSINQLGNIKLYFREFMLNNLQDNKIAPIISAGSFNEKVGDKTFNIFNDHINAYKADPTYRSDLVISNKTIKYKMFALANAPFFKVWYKNGNVMELAYFEKIGKVSNVEAKDGNPAIDGRVLYVRVNPNGTKYVGNLTEDAAPLINSELESTEQIALNYQKARDYYNSMEEYKNAPFRNMSLLTDGVIEQDTEETDNIDGEDTTSNNTSKTNEQFHRLIHLPTLSFQQQEEHAKNLQARFAKVGLDVEVKWANLNGGNSKVDEIDGKLLITIDPEKARQDSVYHEFGHILVDMSQDQEFIKAGIEQLRGGELWNKIATLYPILTDKQLGREVLTTAVGIEAATNDFSNEKGWKFWFNRLLQRISNFIYKITNGRLGNEVNIAKELARQLTRGDIRIDINAEMSEREQWQRSDEYISELNKTHDYLIKVRELYQRLLYMNQLNITPSGEALRRNMQKGIDNINIEVLRENLNYVKTGIALTTMQAISQQELQRFEIILKEQVKIFNNPELDPRNFDKESIKRLTDILYQAREFIANYNEVENIDLKEMEATDLGTLSAEERSVYTAYKGIQNTFDMIKKDDLPRIKQLKLKYKILSDIIRLNVVANTSNPNISDYRKASNETQFDDNIFQSTFLAIGDSHHIVVANLAKIIRTAIDDRDLTYDKMFREFIRSWNTYKSKNGNAKNLFNEYGQLHQEYNREQFRKDAKEYAKQEFIAKDGKLYKNNINDFYREHITYTSKEDIQKAVDIKHQDLLDKKITDVEFAKWILDNLDVDMDGTYKSNNYGIFAKLDDAYRNKKYDALTGADLEMYNTLKTLYDTLFKGLGTLQSKYFLPNIIAKGMKETLKGKNDWFEHENNPEITEHLMNANNERIFQVPLSYVGLISAQPTIAITNQMNTESTDEYETRTLKSVKDNYNLEFKSIEEINDYNEEIKARNKRRHGEAVDYDLGNVIPKLIFSINNYKAKKDIEGLVLVTAANIKEEQIANKNGYGNPIVSKVKNIFVKEKKLETTEGSTSRIYKHLIKSIEMNFYEEFMKPSSHMNTLKALRQYQSILGLGFNLHAGVKNITYGTTQSLLLGSAGTFYSNKDLLAGNADYNKGLTSYFADIHRKDGRYTSIESALVKHFNIISNYNEMMEFDDEGTRAYAMKMFNNAAFAMQESGEHLMQNTLLFTMMRSHRLIDGKLVTFADLLRDKLKVYSKEDIKEGKTVAELKELNKQIREDLKKQFDEATSIRDMFTFEDGVVEVKEEFKDLTKQLSEFKDRVRGVSHKLHGIYNKEDKGAIENTILGQLLMQFRRWAPAGYVNRFGSRGSAFKVEAFWNERRADYDIGSYSALAKFLGASQQDDKYFNSELPIPSMVMQGITNILKDYGNLVANCRLYYNTLTVAEQREATRAIQELGLFVGLVILYIAARNIGGDDKELKRNRAYNFFLYQVSALRAETGTFVPIYGWVNEANKFFKSPAAVWRLGSNLINIGADAIQYPFRDEGNYFKGGRHNKELKLKVHSLQVVPFYPQIDRVFNRNNKEVFGLYW